MVAIHAQFSALREFGVEKTYLQIAKKQTIPMFGMAMKM